MLFCEAFRRTSREFLSGLSSEKVSHLRSCVSQSWCGQTAVSYNIKAGLLERRRTQTPPTAQQCGAQTGCGSASTVQAVSAHLSASDPRVRMHFGAFSLSIVSKMITCQTGSEPCVASRMSLGSHRFSLSFIALLLHPAFSAIQFLFGSFWDNN